MSKKIKFIEGVYLNPLSEVQSCNIGKGTKVWQWVLILQGARVGNDCNICAHSLIEDDVIVGDEVTIKSGVYLWNGLRVEDKVFIGPNATFTNDKYPRSKERPDSFEKTILGHGCSIGANATILCGIEIGENSVIGAGSVVTRNVPPNSKVYGNPARIMFK